MPETSPTESLKRLKSQLKDGKEVQETPEGKVANSDENSNPITDQSPPITALNQYGEIKAPPEAVPVKRKFTNLKQIAEAIAEGSLEPPPKR